MALARATSIEFFARALAAELRDAATVQDIFFETDDCGGAVWLLSNAVDDDVRDAYYETFVTVFRRWPETRVDFHVISPDDFPPGLSLVDAIIPHHARPIGLHSQGG